MHLNLTSRQIVGFPTVLRHTIRSRELFLTGSKIAKVSKLQCSADPVGHTTRLLLVRACIVYLFCERKTKHSLRCQTEIQRARTTRAIVTSSMPTKGPVLAPFTRSDEMEPASPPQTMRDSNALPNLSSLAASARLGAESISEATEPRES